MNLSSIALTAVGSGTRFAHCTWSRSIPQGKRFYYFQNSFSNFFIYFSYICDTCVRTRGRRKPENRFTSKRLPQCKLSQHLEKRVNDFLKKKAPPETPEGCEVVIRVLSSSDKEVEVKPHMKNK